MKKKHTVAKQMIARFVRINAVLREKTADVEGKFYTQFTDLSLMEIHVIQVIDFHTPCTMSQIAKSTQLTLGSITQIIDKLIKKKYAHRKPSETDRRIIYAELSAKGKKVMHACTMHISVVAMTMLEKFNKEEQEKVIQTFERMAED